MHQPMNVVPLAPIGARDILAVAIDLIGQGGIGSIQRIFGDLREAAIDPADLAVQPILIEALVQMLDALEADFASAEVPALALGLDPAFAEAAADLLLIANNVDPAGDLSDLDDGAILIFAALRGAAGKRADGVETLRQARFSRPAALFQRATFQLSCLLQDNSDAAINLIFSNMLDGLDHPEIWPALPVVVEHFPTLIDELRDLTNSEVRFYNDLWGVLHALCIAARGDVADGLQLLEPLATGHSHSPLVQGAFFHIKSLLDPANPAYRLDDRFCATPFDVIDVLDGKSHLCCASWLPESIGDLAEHSWEDVWNSDTAQSIRGSIIDGSFRYCNKIACPKIADNSLPLKRDLVATSARWRDTIDNFRTRVSTGPDRVNLAYDKTCNLSCPSCRTHKVAADSATRARFDSLQEDKILPMLRHAKLALVTGSGDPFASKNFRNLLDRLGAEEYPDLRFQVMTNGMLLTPREWARFPALHGRVAFLRISLDAATGPTHELLRRGARWPVMENNLAFARELRAAGLVDHLDFSFTVQVDNYHEMGQAIDLGHHFGVDHVGFLRLTNWGTFSPEEYAGKAVFMPAHPRHAHFLDLMQDPRLQDPIAGLNDLRQFVRSA